jgi:hypothetical protein
MAVDVVLVLHSEHRRLQQLVERCGRPSRGFHDPGTELQQALHAHMLAATAEIYPTAARLCPPDDWPGRTLAEIRVVAEAESVDPTDLQSATDALVRVESDVVIPVLDAALEVPARRRLGKVFRIRRDAAARNSQASHRRHRTQTELYEVARRAGIEHRSRMTQAELQAALEARGISV